MQSAAIVLGCLCCFGVVLDAFQTIILPRRPTGRFRITRLFYLATWRPWVWLATRSQNPKHRDQFFSIFGPLSLLLLLVLWALLLVSGFALIYFGLGTPFADGLHTTQTLLNQFRTDLFVSGSALLELGLVDESPQGHLARALVVLESGTGLGLVALVIGYVPVLYQAFSRREVNVALLDGRAGSPPTSTELLRRHAYEGGEKELIALLADWERWSAEILESHISYPILCYYRSQHDNQSWLSALVSVLDTCALVITVVEGEASRQAQLTFVMARHALIDLGHVFHVEERAREGGPDDRLPASGFSEICGQLAGLHLRMCGDPASMERLRQIRLLYEPHAQALSGYLRMPLPQWVPAPRKADYWKQIQGLRAGAGREQEFGFGEHVSDRAAAAHLHDEEHGF